MHTRLHVWPHLKAAVLAQQASHDAVVYINSFIHHLQEAMRRQATRMNVPRKQAPQAGTPCIGTGEPTSLFHSHSSVDPSTSDSKIV